MEACFFPALFKQANLIIRLKSTNKEVCQNCGTADQRNLKRTAGLSHFGGAASTTGGSAQIGGS